MPVPEASRRSIFRIQAKLVRDREKNSTTLSDFDAGNTLFSETGFRKYKIR